VDGHEVDPLKALQMCAWLVGQLVDWVVDWVVGGSNENLEGREEGGKGEGTSVRAALANCPRNLLARRA